MYIKVIRDYHADTGLSLFSLSDKNDSFQHRIPIILRNNFVES